MDYTKSNWTHVGKYTQTQKQNMIIQNGKQTLELRDQAEEK